MGEIVFFLRVDGVEEEESSRNQDEDSLHGAELQGTLGSAAAFQDDRLGLALS